MTNITDISALTEAATGVGAVAPEGLANAGGLWGLFVSGGAFMWPILICSIVAFACGLERLISLRGALVMPKLLASKLSALVQAGSIDAAVALCESNKTPFALLAGAVLERADYDSFEMETALEEAGARILYDLRKGSRPLGIIADISPLLGLLGTVWGMIKAFNVVAKAGALGKPELLAEGISEALLTTAFGLCVAIFALILYQYARGRAEGWVRIMEDACIDHVNALRRRKRTDRT